MDFSKTVIRLEYKNGETIEIPYIKGLELRCVDINRPGSSENYVELRYPIEKGVEIEKYVRKPIEINYIEVLFREDGIDSLIKRWESLDAGTYVFTTQTTELRMVETLRFPILD